MKAIGIYVFVLKLFIAISLANEDFYTDDEDNPLISSEIETPKLLQQPAGWDVRLKCSLRGTHADFMTSSDVQWSFLPCGEGYNKTSCWNKDVHQQQVNEWKKILCDGNPCKPTLLIRNPTENDSGLYRCSIQPYKPNQRTTLQIQVVKTYQLDVINLTIAAPEILDELPSNTTAYRATQVVLQCRIHSKVPPSIKWFRRQDSSLQVPFETDDYNSRAIQYFENVYEFIESAGEKGLSEDTYLSKLILNNVSDRDSGFYVCVGINYRGFKMRESYLNVIPYQSDEEVSTKASFLLLFLIPIGLALVPLLLWICYLIARSKSRKEMVKGNNPLQVKYVHVYLKNNNV